MSKTHEEKKRNNHRIYMSTMRKIRKTSSVSISNQHILQDKPINNNLQSQVQSSEQIHYLNEDRENIDDIQSSSDDSSSDNNEPESELKLLNFKNDSQLSPAVHQVSPTVHQVSPAVHQVSPTVHQVSPAVHQVSPAVHQVSPAVHQVSPTVHQVSPAVHQVSPTVHQVSTAVQQDTSKSLTISNSEGKIC